MSHSYHWALANGLDPVGSHRAWVAAGKPNPHTAPPVFNARISTRAFMSAPKPETADTRAERGHGESVRRAHADPEAPAEA
jgi:hypothetical protein